MSEEIFEINQIVRFKESQADLDNTQKAYAGREGKIISKEHCFPRCFYYEVLIGRKILSAYAKRLEPVAP